MLRSFIDWLDDYLDGQGPSAVPKAIVGLLGFAALLGAILGSAAVRAGAIVVVLLLVLATMLILLRDRRRIRQDAYQYRRLLSRYCNFLADRPKAIVRLDRWEQVAIVEPNGDTKEVIQVHATALRKELYFLQFTFYPGWEQPARYHKRVKLSVRVVRVDGTRGPDCDVTHSWTPDGGMDVIAHLHSPAVLGSEIHLEIEWHWPGKFQPLARDRKPDDFTLLFTNLTPVVIAQYMAILPPGEDVYYSPIGFSESDEDYEISSERRTDGRVACSFTGRSIPIGQRVGMKLQLK
jgi:hypothetical protein